MPYASVNRVRIGSDNVLSPIRRQAIIYAKAGLMSIRLLGANFSELSIKIQNFHSRKCIWEYLLRNGGHFVLGEMSYTLTFWHQDNKSHHGEVLYFSGCLNTERAIPYTQNQRGYILFYTWIRHQMETFFALLTICVGNSLLQLAMNPVLSHD